MTSYDFLILSPLRNRLKYVSNNSKERALSESQFLHRKNGRVAQRLLFLKHLRFAAGLGPQAKCIGVPFRVKRGLGKQIFLIAAGRPRPS
jgi:hypothetical protein